VQLDHPGRGATSPRPAWRDSATPPRDSRLAVDLFHRHGITPGPAKPQPRAAGRVQLDHPGRGATSPRPAWRDSATPPRDSRLAVDLFHRHGITPGPAKPQPRRQVECNSTIPGGERRALGRRGATAPRLPGIVDLQSTSSSVTASLPAPPHRNLGGRSSATRPSRAGSDERSAGVARQRHTPRDSRLAVDLFHRHGITPGSATPQPRAAGRVQLDHPGRGATSPRPAWRDSATPPGIVDLQSTSSTVTASLPAPPHRNLGRRVECNSTIPGRPREVMRDKPTAGATRSGLFICAAQTENAG
jgi:hypothetical protein